MQGTCRLLAAAVGASLLLLGVADLLWQGLCMAGISKLSVVRGVWLTHVVGGNVRVSGNACARL